MCSDIIFYHWFLPKLSSVLRSSFHIYSLYTYDQIHIVSLNTPHIKRQRPCFTNKGPSSQSYGFSSSHVRMWELSHKESWAPKNWRFWTVMLEKTRDSKEIKLVNPKGNQSRIFTGRTDAEAEAPILWPPMWRTESLEKTLMKDWRWEEKGTIENEMVGWHCWLHGHEFEQPPGVGDGQGSLVCCNPWGCKESDMTERLNWTKLK